MTKSILAQYFLHHQAGLWKRLIGIRYSNLARFLQQAGFFLRKYNQVYCIIRCKNHILTELTLTFWYEWFIIAMSKLSKTIILITENEPNIKSPENRVNSLMPVNSKLSRSTRPNMAQNKVWTVSQRLQKGGLIIILANYIAILKKIYTADLQFILALFHF